MRGGKVSVAKPKLSIVGLGMDRDVVELHANPRFSQLLKDLPMGELQPLQPQADNVEVKSRIGVVAPVGGNQVKVGEKGVIALGKLMAAGDKVVEAAHLARPEGRLDVCHAVIEAQLDLLVVPGAVGLLRHEGGLFGDAMGAKEG